MSANLAKLPILQTPLDAILRSEISLSNKIDAVQIGGWSKVDVIVTQRKLSQTSGYLPQSSRTQFSTFFGIVNLF